MYKKENILSDRLFITLGGLEDTLKNTADYRTIEIAMHVLEDRAQEYSGAEEIAARMGLSRDHLDTVFARWAGVGLTRFMQSLTLSRTRQRLLETRGLLASWPQPGPVGTGHQAFWICCQLRLLPCGQEKGQGKSSAVKTPGFTITYGLYPSPFGDCFLAMTGREICNLSFVDGGEWLVHLDELRRNWPQATIIADDGESGRQMVERIFTSAEVDPLEPFSLLLKGTPFQVRVWQALLTLPRGAMTSYQDLAVYIGHPTACRAVASAVAANPVGYLIPCHRVIRKSGEIHHYRWGTSRKKALLGWETCGP